MKENALIERVSDLLSLNYNETCRIVEKLFSEIIKYLIKGECFHIDNIGSFFIKYNFEEYAHINDKYIYFPPKISLEFDLENNPGDKKLSDIVVNLSKDDYNMARYFKVCINSIKCILLEDSKVYIEDFGTFKDGEKITFSPDIYISYLINPFFNLEKRFITKEEYESKKKQSIETFNDDLLNGDRIGIDELFKGFNEEPKNIKENSKENTYTKKVFDCDDIVEDLAELDEGSKNLGKNDDDILEELELIEENIMPDDIFKKLDKDKKIESDNADDNTNDIEEIIKTHTTPKKTFDIKEDLYSNNRYNNNAEKIYKININEDVEKKNSLKYNQDEEYKIISEKIKKDKKKNISFFKLFLIFASIVIICFGLGIGIYSITLTKTKIAYIKSSENLETITEDYFYFSDDIELSYITPRDMYFWDIAKSLYDKSSYWPLIYALNQRSFRADKIIKKGERIVYKNLNSADINNTATFKKSRLNPTLSKAYIALYPLFIKYGNTNHANWAAAMSAFYDRKIFEDRKYFIPDELYNDILLKLK